MIKSYKSNRRKSTTARKSTTSRIPSGFARRLAAVRIALAKTQHEVAELLGIKSYTTIFKYEQAKLAPSLGQLAHLASAWRINSHWLLTGHGPWLPYPIAVELSHYEKAVALLREVPDPHEFREIRAWGPGRLHCGLICCDRQGAVTIVYPTEPPSPLTLRALLDLVAQGWHWGGGVMLSELVDSYPRHRPLLWQLKTCYEILTRPADVDYAKELEMFPHYLPGLQRLLALPSPGSRPPFVFAAAAQLLQTGHREEQDREQTPSPLSSSAGPVPESEGKNLRKPKPPSSPSARKRAPRR